MTKILTALTALLVLASSFSQLVESGDLTPSTLDGRARVVRRPVNPPRRVSPPPRVPVVRPRPSPVLPPGRRPIVRRPPVARDPRGRPVPQPVTRVRVRPGRPFVDRYNHGRVIYFGDASHRHVLPATRVHVHYPRPSYVPVQPSVNIHIYRYSRHFLGDHSLWIAGVRVDIFYYYVDGYYWVWHDGHYDWWDGYRSRFWCPTYMAYIDWGLPAFFITPIINRPDSGYAPDPILGRDLLRRGNDYLYWHGNHYDASADDADALDLSFYCTRADTFYELILPRFSCASDDLGDGIYVDGRLGIPVPGYDLYWDPIYQVYVSIPTRICPR